MILGLDGITVAYGKKDILRDVSLEIRRGEILTLIGQNGCGKSTLLRCAAGVLAPKAGRVLLKDRPLTAYSPRRRARLIAYLAQSHDAPPDIDVRTLVSCGRYPYRRFGGSLCAEDETIVDRALAVTDLTHLQHRSLSSLSGGEARRAWIAMNTAQQPEIMLLDEPITYLDIGHQIEVLELIRRLRDETGVTVLMVLHDLNLAARYSDRMCILRGGGVYACDTPDAILTAENLRTVFRIEAKILRDAENGCPYYIPLRPEHREEEA